MKKIALILLMGALVGACASPKVDKAEVVMENILQRKSVRTYTSEKVTSEQIQTLLRAAMSAPSGSNIQPWSFVVLQDSSKYKDIFTEKNFNLPMFERSSALIVLCSDTTVVRRPRGASEDTPAVRQPNGTWRDDMGACTENLLLAAEAMGLGAVWTACYPYKDRYVPVKTALGLPPEVVPYAVVPIGYPGGDEQPKDKWKEDRIHYGKW